VTKLTTLALLFLAASAPLRCRTFEFRYALELEHDGDSIPVSQLSAFQTGDRLKIRVFANQAGFCYLAVGQAAGYFLLTPGRSVEAHSWVDLPAGEWLRFDRRPGVEMIYLIVASRPLEELERAEPGGLIRESALLRIRKTYQSGVKSERTEEGDSVRLRQKSADDRSIVVLESMRLRHR
jgi:hypothetical protein